MIEQPDYQKPGWCNECRSLGCSCEYKPRPKFGSGIAAIKRHLEEVTHDTKAGKAGREEERD